MEFENLKTLFSIRDNILNYFSQEKRLETFQEWPYRRGKCTAKRMSETGFIHIKDPNNENSNSVTDVVCIVCWKELDGWESRDDPRKEHEKHSPTCQSFEFDCIDTETQNCREIITLLMYSNQNFHKKIEEKLSKEWNRQCHEIVQQIENVK